MEIISEILNINTVGNDDNDSECEAELTMQVEVFKALNILRYFSTNLKDMQKHFKTIREYEM